eukprot:1069474-Pleurochrysis_carterae.AAC.1
MQSRRVRSQDVRQWPARSFAALSDSATPSSSSAREQRRTDHRTLRDSKHVLGGHHSVAQHEGV